MVSHYSHSNVTHSNSFVISSAARGKSGTPISRNVKKELERPGDFDESQNGNSFMKMEAQQEFDGDEDDEYSHDDYSHSLNSTSLPPTPEPRNATPTLHTTRPSSKSSSFSDSLPMNSQLVSNFQMADSVTTTSSPTPERKPTSFLVSDINPCMGAEEVILIHFYHYFRIQQINIYLA